MTHCGALRDPEEVDVMITKPTPLKMYAILTATPADPKPGDLVLVEVPQNCSVDPLHPSELRARLLEAIAIAREACAGLTWRTWADIQLARLIELENA